MIELPTILRPRGASYRRLSLGLDLPAWFYDNIKAIDQKLYFVHHPYRVLWDDVINTYSGSLSDPRNYIHQEFGWENWGYVLTDGKGAPIEDGAWHLWRLADPFGWAHVIKIDSKDPDYLTLLTDRLHLQAVYKNKSIKAWRDKQMQDEQDRQEKSFKDREAKFNDVRDENSWLTRKAMENLDRGVINSSNPQHGQIISYPGQKNRSTIRRGVTDEEAGLITPD
jgi:hypothetical protein